MIKLMILNLVIMPQSLLFAENGTFTLDYNQPNYNFVIPATGNGKTTALFDDCSEKKGFSHNLDDEVRHISSIHKDGTVIYIEVDEDISKSESDAR